MQLIQIDITPIARQAPNIYENWMMAVLLVVFLMLAYVRTVYYKRLQRLGSSLFRIQILRQTMREELVFSHRASLILFFQFILISALLLYGAIKHYGWQVSESSGLKFYLILVLAIGLVYIVKLLLANLLKWLYSDQGLIREYLFEVVLINKAASIILLPFALAMIFINISALNNLFVFVLILLIIMMLFRTAQGIVSSTSYPVSQVYIILYLCTFEILPFLVLLKAFRTEIA